MFNPFIVSSSLHVFTILSKHFQMVPSHVGLVEGGVLNVCSDSPCECKNGTFKHNCKQRPERHAQALNWISILCLCVTKERRMAGGFPTSFQFRFPMFDSISRTAVTVHGELMVARLLGTHLNFGVPLSYVLLLS